MKRTLIGWGGILLCALYPLITPAPASAAPARQFSNEQVFASVRDQAGRLHVLWVEQQSPERFLLLYQLQTLSGSPLAPALLIQESRSRLRRPHVMIDADGGAVHALWQERFAKEAGARNAEGTWVHYARLSSGGQGASILRQEILNQRPLAQHPDLGVDRQGIAYAMWEEGRKTLLLARVQDNRPVTYRRIATDFGRNGHGYPALAVGGRGDLHLTWSAITPAGTQQIVYAAVSRRDFSSARLVAVEAVYTAASPSDQPKRIRVAEQTGRVTIHWKNQHREGPLGRLAASSGSVSFTTGRGVAERIVVHDTVLAPAAAPAPSIQYLAVAGKAPVIRPSSAAVLLATVYDDGMTASRLARRAEGIDKRLMARLLAFTSWSGAPPAAGLVRFSSPRSCSVSLFSQQLNRPVPLSQSAVVEHIDAFSPDSFGAWPNLFGDRNVL
jgi:hypothetical protein